MMSWSGFLLGQEDYFVLLVRINSDVCAPCPAWFTLSGLGTLARAEPVGSQGQQHLLL